MGQLTHVEASNAELLDALPIPGAILDRDGRIVAAGRAWTQAAGEVAFAAASCGIGANYVRACELAASEGSDTHRALVTCVRGVRDGDGDEVELEYDWEWQGGARRMRARVAALGSNPPRSVLLTHADVTERQELVAGIRDTRTQLEAVMLGTSDGIVMIDANQHIVSFNRAAEEAFGYRATDVRGKSLDVLIPESFRDAHRRNVETFQRGRVRRRLMRERDELLAVRRDGSEFPVEITISRLDFGGKPHAMAIIRDVTTWHESPPALRHRASHDELTNLPNRASLTDRLDAALRDANARRLLVGVVYADLDGFKEVNDRLGHAAGDAVLEEVGARLQATVRAGDFAARVGGDEFVVVLTRIQTVVDARRAVTRIVTDLSGTVPTLTGTVPYSASAGVSIYPTDGSDAATLLAKADAAMYAVKRAGGRTSSDGAHAAMTPERPAEAR